MFKNSKKAFNNTIYGIKKKFLSFTFKAELKNGFKFLSVYLKL